MKLRDIQSLANLKKEYDTLCNDRASLERFEWGSIVLRDNGDEKVLECSIATSLLIENMVLLYNKKIEVVKTQLMLRGVDDFS